MKKIIVFLLMILCFIPVCVRAEELIPNATSGLLMDIDSGKIIFEKDINKKVAVASMTKMMAQIIIMEKIEEGVIKWDDVVVVSKNAADMGGSQIYIAEGERISIEDLMKGISMASGNDATVMMAEVISGTEAKFVELMNKKAKELGLRNTNFKNSTGLDEENHYSSAYDMAIIAKELITKHPDILKFSSVYEDYLREDSKNKFWLVNTNKLVHFYDGADGLKTGHTDDAGYCLAATAKRGNLRILGIVLGEKSAAVRNEETMELLDFGFANLKVNKLKSKGEVVEKIKVDKADRESLNIVLKEDLFVTERVGDNKKYDYEVILDKVKLPVKAGDIVGEIVVYSDNRKLKSSSLTIDKDVKSLSFIKLLFQEFVDYMIGEF